MALVTGAGSGLGEAIARRLAADGAVVVVNDLDPAAAERVAKEIDGDVAPFDVTDVPAVDAAFTAAIERHGRLDILVNNAGIAHNRPEVTERSMANQLGMLEGKEWQPVRATSSLDDASWDRMIKVHLYGTFHCTRAALRHMEDVRSGAIVNIASIAGMVAVARRFAYCATKGAVISMTQSTAMDYVDQNIRCNCICPGTVQTPFVEGYLHRYHAGEIEETRQALHARQPIGRMGRPEEIAPLALYLASDEAAYVTGAQMVIDGGLTAR